MTKPMMHSVLRQSIEVNNPNPVVSHAIENVKTLAEARQKIEAARRGTYGLVGLYYDPLPFDPEFVALKTLCDTGGIYLVIGKPKQRAAP